MTAPAARIEAARGAPDAPARLVAMLAEQSPLYAGRGTNAAERLRGYVLASFETAGLPAAAVPFVLEELETGINPYTVAAAARALRGSATVPAEAPDLLVRAIARLRGADDVVSFEWLAPEPAGGATALAELARTLVLLGPRARSALAQLEELLDAEGDGFAPAVRAEIAAAVAAIGHDDACCHPEPPAAAEAHGAAAAVADLASLAFEDQDGARLSFSDAFSGRPSAIAFFYTRCMNPEKCSLTVTRLGRLARRLADAELDTNVAGITYDPRFDRPARMKAYGADRGMTFSPRSRLLRTAGPFEPLRAALDLGVGFGPVTVNRHRLDLVVLDASLAVAARFERRLWHEETVLEALRTA